MIEKLMPKGWTACVDEAITKTIHDRIDTVIKERFPDVKVTAPDPRGGGREPMTMNIPGFDYSIRAYIQSRYVEIMKADPEIDAIIKAGLKRCLLEGFAATPR